MMSVGSPGLPQKGRISILKTDNTYIQDTLGARFMPPGVNFRAKMIGEAKVPEGRGEEMCKTELIKLKAQADVQRQMNKAFHKHKVIVNVSLEGVKVIEAVTADVLQTYSVKSISYIQPDPVDNRALGFISGMESVGFTFVALKTERPAAHVVLTLRDLFQMVFNMKKRENDQDTPAGIALPQQARPAPAQPAMTTVAPPKPARQESAPGEMVSLQKNIDYMTAAVGTVTLQAPTSPTSPATGFGDAFAAPQQQPTPIAAPPTIPARANEQPNAGGGAVFGGFSDPWANQPQPQQPPAFFQPQMAPAAGGVDAFGAPLLTPERPNEPEPAEGQEPDDPFAALVNRPTTIAGVVSTSSKQLFVEMHAKDKRSINQIRQQTVMGVTADNTGNKPASDNKLAGLLDAIPEAKPKKGPEAPPGTVATFPAFETTPAKPVNPFGTDLQGTFPAMATTPAKPVSGTFPAMATTPAMPVNGVDDLDAFLGNGARPGVPDTPEDPLKTKVMGKITDMIEEFLGVGDAKLAEAIYELGVMREDPSEFAEQVALSDLKEFGFTDGFVFDLWGAMEDVRAGREKS